MLSIDWYVFSVNLGPPVSQITSQNDFSEAKDRSEIFFLFAGEEDGPLWDTYLKVCDNKYNISKHKYKNISIFVIKNGICKITFHFSQISGSYQQHEFFYRSDAKLAESFSGVKGETQSIRVYKDGKSYKFESNET